MLEREAVLRRLRLINSSASSIVGIATWCAIHGADMELILTCLAEQMRSPATSDSARASMLYVLHEIILSYCSKEVSDATRVAVFRPIVRHLPVAMDAVLALPSTVELSEVSLALTKVLAWWAPLQVFPAAWMSTMQDKAQRMEVLTESSPSTSVVAALQHAAALSMRYQTAKERWLRTSKLAAHADVASAGDVAACRDAALRALAALRKNLSASSLGAGDATTAAWLASERALVEGSAAAGIKAEVKQEEPPRTMVKRETVDASAAGRAATADAPLSARPPTAEVAAEEEEEDVLASFY